MLKITEDLDLINSCARCGNDINECDCEEGPLIFREGKVFIIVEHFKESTKDILNTNY